MIGIGMFGAGKIAGLHARNLALRSDARLVGIYDPNQEASKSLSDLYHCQTYSSAEELLSDAQIDAVMICSISDTHLELIKASARAGKAVFCEKPIAMTLPDILNCRDILEETKTPFCLGFNRRFDPSIAQIKYALQHGEVGKVHHISLFSRNDLYPPAPQLETSRGLFLDMTVHDFDLARWLLDERPVEIYATASCVVGQESATLGCVDTATVTIKSQSGAIATIQNSRQAAFMYDQRIEVHGSEGLIAVSNPAQKSASQFSRDGATADVLYENFPERYQQAYEIELSHFISVAQGRHVASVSLIDGLWAHLIARAASQSIEQNRPVSIEQPETILTSEEVLEQA